jgi:hypothetical protein
MKFDRLPIGSRFRYDGTLYVKTGPLQARPESGGGERMIPRWADLSAGEGEAPDAGPARSPRPDPGAVRAAVDAYHRRCATLLAETCPDAGRREAILATLTEAHRDLLAVLDPEG